MQQAQVSIDEPAAKKDLAQKFRYFVEFYSRRSRAVVRVEILIDHQLGEVALINLSRQALKESGNFQKEVIG